MNKKIKFTLKDRLFCIAFGMGGILFTIIGWLYNDPVIDAFTYNGFMLFGGTMMLITGLI